jgi:hypothetical protein
MSLLVFLNTHGLNFLKNSMWCENIFMHKSRWVVRWLWSFQASWKITCWNNVNLPQIPKPSINNLHIYWYDLNQCPRLWYKQSCMIQMVTVFWHSFSKFHQHSRIMVVFLKKSKIQASIYQQIDNFFNTQ